MGVVGLVFGGIGGSLLLALVLVVCCAGPLAVAKSGECKNPPNRFKEPLRFEEWQRKCNEGDNDNEELASEDSVSVSLLKL